MVLDGLPGLYGLKYDSVTACGLLLYLCSYKLDGSATSTLEGRNLRSHSMLPLLVSSSFLIGRRLSQNGSSEAKAIGRTKGTAVTKSIARRRLRMRSKDGRGRVKWWCRAWTTSVVVSDLMGRTQQ